MENTTISFQNKSKSPLQMRYPPPPQVARKNIPIKPNSIPVRQISRSPIPISQNGPRTLQNANQNIRMNNMAPPENKKIDINLNIKVNNDDSITVNQPPQGINANTQPIRGNIQGQPIRPQSRPQIYPNSHQNIIRNQPPFRSRVPINNFNPVHQNQIFKNPPLINPYYYQNPQKFNNQRPESRLSGGSGVSSQSRSSPSRSRYAENSNFRITPVKEERIYCVICEEQYSEEEKDDHIRKHQRSYEEQKKSINLANVIHEYQQAEEFIERPIVEPIEYNIQYDHPIQFVYEKKLQEQRSSINQQQQQPYTNTESRRISTSPSYRGSTLERIEEEKQRPYEPYEKQQIRLSQEEESAIYLNDYDKYRTERKKRQNTEIYPERSSHRKVEVPEELEEKKQNFILDNEEEGVADLDYSPYKNSSIGKRVYNPEQYQQKSRQESERFTYQPPNESEFRNSTYDQQPYQQHYSSTSSYNEHLNNPRNSSIQPEQYRESNISHHSVQPSQYESHVSVQPSHQSYVSHQTHLSTNRFSQIREAPEHLQNSNLKNSHQMRESATSEIRSSQPRVIEPEIPLSQIIGDTSSSNMGARESSQAYNYEISGQKKKRLPSNKLGW